MAEDGVSWGFRFHVKITLDVVPPELLDADLDEDLEREAAALGHGRHRATAEVAAPDHLPDDLRHQRLAVGVNLGKNNDTFWIFS